MSFIFFIPATISGAKNNKFVVVIDAGHGGKDTGAVDNKVSEKDINLGIALKLEELLKKRKDFKVILTRNSDKFLSLSDRANKANKEKADLFISIHTNSLDQNNPNRKTTEGASVYVLGLHRDADNLAVARRENQVIVKENNHEEKYEGFDPNKDESYIIFEMAQKKNLSQSIGFARDVQNELVKTAGRKDRGVHQAGFLVLRETAMPAVLIETDFICNPQSAKYISSSAGQKKLAQAIANAVVMYRNNIVKKGDKAYADATLEEPEDNSGDVFVLVSDTAESDRTVGTAKRDDNMKRQSTAPRKRRSVASKKASSSRNLETDHIAVRSEAKGKSVAATPGQSAAPEAKPVSVAKEKTSAKVNKKKADDKKNNKKKNSKKKSNDNDDDNVRTYGNKKVHIGKPSSSNPRSLKSSKETTGGTPVKTQPAKPATPNKANERDVKKQSVQKTETKNKTPKQQKEKEKQTDKKKAKDSVKKEAKQQNKTEDPAQNRKKYEETIQKSADKNKTTSAPRSLKSKKHNK